MTHGQLVNQIRLALGDGQNAVLWPNNTGAAIHHSGHRVRYGLTIGSADLIGLTAEGRFLALEVKVGRDRVRPEQALFLALVQRMGGFATVVHSVHEAEAALARARRGERQ